MATFVLSPATTWDSQNTAYRTPRVMMEQGSLRAYTQRENGTMRHLELAPLGSDRRDTAEWIYDRVQDEEDSASVKSIARELHVSVATVRRYLLSLQLTEEIEAGEWDGLMFDASGEPVWGDNPTDDTDDSMCTCAAEFLGNAWHTNECELYVHPDDRLACEAEGTTADDLVADLAASLAQVGK